MIVLHAAPKTQPGGVHGALERLVYQSEGTPSPVKYPPMASAEKFTRRNINTLKIIILNYLTEFSRTKIA